MHAEACGHARARISTQYQDGPFQPLARPVSAILCGDFNLLPGPADPAYARLQEPIGNIVNALRESLERTPPELAADIVDRGIFLTGGGALLRGLDLLLREVTNLNIRVAQDPLTSVVLGAGKILEQPEDFEKVLMSGHRD